MEWIYSITMCYSGKKKFHIFNTGFELGLFIQCLGRHGFPSTRFYALIFSQLIPNVSVWQKNPCHLSLACNHTFSGFFIWSGISGFKQLFLLRKIKLSPRCYDIFSIYLDAYSICMVPNSKYIIISV